MILKVFSDNIPDSVEEGLRLTQALTKEDLEFLLGDKYVNLILHFLLLLLLVKKSGNLEECSNKWYWLLTFGPGGSKIVLILLKEVISFQVSFNLIYIQESGLHRLSTRAFVLLRGWYKSGKRKKRSKI